jgi:hypothetical protein
MNCHTAVVDYLKSKGATEDNAAGESEGGRLSLETVQKEGKSKLSIHERNQRVAAERQFRLEKKRYKRWSGIERMLVQTCRIHR